MENEELNKRLLKFAGFKRIRNPYATSLGEQAWKYPDGGWDLEKDLPNFPESLDTIFKWLVPLVIKKFGEDATLELLTEWVQSLILTYTIDQAPNILAKLIEQLIDKGE